MLVYKELSLLGSLREAPQEEPRGAEFTPREGGCFLPSHLHSPLPGVSAALGLFPKGTVSLPTFCDLSNSCSV